MSFLDADYSAIEARIVCWLAGQEDALEEYRAGIDRYKVMASLIYGIPEAEVNKFPQRFIGKQAILLSGFQGGPAKFRQTCEKFGYKELPLGLEYTAVEAFRGKHRMVTRYWNDVDKTAKRAILHPGEVFTIKPTRLAPEVAFSVRTVGGMPFLLIRLPSGRKLAYPRPRIAPSKKYEGGQSIFFFGRIGTTANWGDCDTYGGKLVENCLSGSTQILTPQGWKELRNLSLVDKVWDGAAFVTHGGVVCKGEQPTISFHGMQVTPDHRFLAGRYWVTAETACTNPHIKLSSINEVTFLPPSRPALGLDRRHLWELVCYQKRGRGWQENNMDMPVRLREPIGENRFRFATEESSRSRLLPQMSNNESSPWGHPSYAQHEQPSCLLGMAKHEGKVFQSKAQSVEELRGQGDNRLPSLAGFFPSFLAGHGANLQTWIGHRQERQQRELHPQKLPVVHTETELQKSPQHLENKRCHQIFLGRSFASRYKTIHALLSAKSRVDMEANPGNPGKSRQLVYDIRNCGPRNQFAVKGSGLILIAHNCTQAVAADVMANGAHNAEGAGYQIATLIHDEALSYYHEGQTPEEFVELLTDLPSWADGLPVEAKGELVPFYRKG